LRELVIDGCPLLTDETAAILERSSRLRFLSMSGCTLLTDEGVEHLAKLCVRTLLSLDLSRCPRLSWVSARLLADENSKLVELDLSGCNVDADSLRELQRSVSALSATDIS